LRRDLEGAGHRFSTHSDVETIVHGFQDDGLGVLGRLRGMFAFALWDRAARRLVLARDRLGEKPLYTYRDARGLWFSSEIQSLLAAVRDPKVTAEALYLFLTFQYVPEPATPVAGIEPVPRGTCLSVMPGRPPESHQYWNLFGVAGRGGDPVETVREVVPEACRLMGTADVPVGLALSGGIDSSLVAAISGQLYPGQLHAFTIGYRGRPAVDERAVAEASARRFGFEFHDVELSDEDVVRDFPALVHALDTPIADPAAYGYYAVARAARAAGVPVLLSGLGGDEFFWGYEWVREAARARLAPAPPRNFLARLFGPRQSIPLVPPFFAVHEELRAAEQLARDVVTGAAALPEGLWLSRTALPKDQPQDLAVSDCLNRTWLLSNCLALGDRATMAHSVELRLPFLDADLVDRVTALRRGGLRDVERPHKWLLLEALGGLLPEGLAARPKQGFTPPVHQWLAMVLDAYEPLLDDGALAGAGLIDPARLQAHPGRTLTIRYKMLCLELWMRTVIHGQRPDELSTGRRAMALA
jgi:asparagine synthase (glutamine-hydrolysing)